MYFSIDEILELMAKYNITMKQIKGVLHIGAHECEELELYEELGINRNNIIWIDANKKKVEEARMRNIPNVYYGVISEEDGQLVDFNITNNGQSSSVLRFGSHSINYPAVKYIERQIHLTTTVDTFYKKQGLDMTKYNFWNFDIQGAELLALKGAKDSIKYAKVIYLEINIEEVYKGCALIGELDEFLLQHNFVRVATKIAEYGWGDAIYIKQNVS